MLAASTRVKPCEDPAIPHPGKVFYGGRWRTPERIEEIRRQNLAYRDNNREAFDAAVRRRYERHRNLMMEVKAGEACMRCGFNDPRALDFHHRDPSQKKFGLGTNGRSWSWRLIEEEIAKCDVLCANCHRILHAEEAEERAA